jgi:hypothetical protein
MKIQCLQLASSIVYDGQEVVKTAQAMFEWITGEKPAPVATENKQKTKKK